jgi:hypothetical protein
LLLAAFVAVAIAACGGGSSGDANSLLQQTFSGTHAINSGNVNVALTLNPSGSSTIKGPISLTLGGPFASLGTGKVPKSNFNVAISGLGHTGQLGILSTGTTGYVTMNGTSYQLPAATFQQLESSFSSLTSSGRGSSSGALGKLGINPLHWLVNPKIAGNETVGGANTTHIHAGVNVPALLNDLNTFLGKASSLGVSGASRLPTSISSSTQTRIANAVRQPQVDVWTGTSDKTLRRIAVGLAVPVTGQLSSLLGGLNSTHVSFTLQYADLNQPQTIVAPTSVAPFKEFQSKLQSILSSIQGVLGGAATGTASSGASPGTSSPSRSSGSPSGSSGSPSGSSGSSSGSSGSSSGTSGSAAGTPGARDLSKYSQCLQSAGSDVAKMQQCSSLLNSK